MAKEEDNEKQVHPIVRLDYIVRLIACPFELLIVASSRLADGEPVNAVLWITLGTYGLIWPHVAYVFGKRSDDVRTREEQFLTFDAAAAGIAIALASFRPVPTLVIVTALLTVLSSVGGVRLLIAGMAAMAAAVLLTGSFVTDFALKTITPVPAEILSAAILLLFQTMMGLLTWRTARNFVTSRRQIAEQSDQIRMQNEQLVEAREEALQAAKAKSAFLATMSHEIRTPLNGVLGMTRLLEETPLSPEQHDLLRTIQVSGNTLVTVINDILDYSRIESGRFDLEEEPLSIAQVVEESLEIVSERARDKGLELICDVSPEVPRRIFGDSTRLRQVVTNLVGNAVKFTEQGEVVVTVRLVRPEIGEQPAEIGVYVRDTGIGIPEDRISNLFTPFSQADASTTRRYGGTGLGLAISKRIVELMGGTIAVKSFVGQGTTFTFTLRCRIAPSDELKRHPAEVRGKRVLVVDDNATNRRVLCGQLDLWGFDATGTDGANHAQKALEAEGPFDLAIVDYHMPDVDGMMLGRQIRRAHVHQKLPMILLSSSLVLSKDDPERLFAARLLKPARQSSLFDAIMVALGVTAPPPQSRMSEPGNLVPSDAPALNILVADDNEINRNVAALVLKRFGYEIDLATNGRDALERVTHRSVTDGGEGPYDLVFMDVQMPEMDGLEATRAIRRLEAERPSQHWPRIVAMTANAMQEDREACLEAGMDDHLAKPLDFDAVGKVIRDTAASFNRTDEASSGTAAIDADELRTTEAGDIIDWSRLDELREYDTPDGALVNSTIESLTGQIPERVAEIRSAVERGDAETLRESAHRLKGAASNVGAVRLADVASRIEQSGRVASLGGIDTLIGELEDIAGETHLALKERSSGPA